MLFTEKRWQEALLQRKLEGNLRSLRGANTNIDFCSNDYLGIARSTEFGHALLALAQQQDSVLAGSGGSRLICGNSVIKENAEAFIATTHGTESALLFPSGYMANLALVSALAKRTDTIIVDECIHRSIHDGCRLSFATKLKFRHNDCNHLESLLQSAKGQLFVIVESLYSMEGDFAPLTEIVGLCKQYAAALIVDEAHTMGVFDWGIVYQNGYREPITATVVTYGKAMGCYGAAIIGSDLLKQYLVNFAAPLIYSTAFTDMQALSIRASYEYVDHNIVLRRQLQDNIQYFRSAGVHCGSAAQSPVQVVLFKEPKLLDAAIKELASRQLMVGAIRSPTVKKGSERLRIGIHAYNSTEEMDQLCGIIKSFQ